MLVREKVSSTIEQSEYISRDLSWLQFNWRVLDQTQAERRNLFEKMKFLAITASNLDEFFTIRVGSLYNYLDYNKERLDYSGLKARPFRKVLLDEAHHFVADQYQVFQELMSHFEENGFRLATIRDLREIEKEEVELYFRKTIYPMLTPMVYDSHHAFPILRAQTLVFGVVTQAEEGGKSVRKASFVQVPQNLPRFYEIKRKEDEEILFVPIETIIRWQIGKLYKNIKILSVDLFRITRNGDFTLEESDDIETDFINEIRSKLKSRRTGRVVRVEVLSKYSEWLMKILKERWQIDDDNIFIVDKLLDLTCLWQIIKHPDFADELPPLPNQVLPLRMRGFEADTDLFDILKERDILLHHPYNSFEPFIELLEQAAEDAHTLAIKITIYRLAKNSRITEALLKAAENGKHVSVLFELKARFDEENNIREAQRLQKAGCYVVYGIGGYKTHTKLCLIVRKEDNQIVRYVHLSSGNYNEETARLYTDVGLLTTDEDYAEDVSEFFNVITGHSVPDYYKCLITAPREMRTRLAQLIRNEAENARKGLKAGIAIKVNSLEDREIINELYEASKAGVPIKLMIRGICCLRPQRVGLSENIEVRSIVGDYLEHTRLYYFYNDGNPLVYGGSADMMVRSFDRRLESLFLITDKFLRMQATAILAYNFRDNVNAYVLQEDGSYKKVEIKEDEKPFNIHKEFYKITEEDVKQAKIFDF
ncbi:polyphosphate kinase 1 [Raineya orbicola]|uniref:Polyphosphate kinase n=1 Tax=Raineya orbicola TaxID=2016530 RepID=A0A2N3IC28_9BACT|nr:polyphosphate kinase 1 [Raineya orbicola]PKQ67839.1 Polyphosphate kinase 1 [Raineya orbicola]